MNLNVTCSAAFTMASPPYANESVMSPQRRANAGNAAPIPNAATVPTAIMM